MNSLQEDWTEKLKKIEDLLDNLLQKDSCDEICRSEKQTSTQLMYLLKCSKFFLITPDYLRNFFKQCMKKLITLIKSTQYENYGHKFPIFWFVVSKYGLEKLQDVQYNSNQQKNLSKIKSESSLHYQGIDSFPISIDELYCLRNRDMTKFFTNIVQNKTILQNNQCLNCSQVFIKDFILNNNNFYYSQKIIFYISAAQLFDKSMLLKYISALSNAGGGTILVGADKKRSEIKAVGIKFRNPQEIDDKQRMIYQMVSTVKPGCSCVVERVLVHSNYVTGENVAKEFLRMCFRILITPKNGKKISYFEVEKKGYDKTYQFYICPKSRPQKIATENIYQSLHKIYNLSVKKQSRSSHQNILHHKPYNYYSLQFVTGCKEGQFLQQEMYQSDEEEQHIPIEDQVDDEPVFKFQKNNLLIACSQNQQKYVKGFSKYLRQILPNSQNDFDVFKLYGESFTNMQRSVFVISHSIQVQSLKSHLAVYMQKNSLKPDTITLTPTHPVLQIQSAKFTHYIEQQLKKRIYYRFNESMSFARKKSQIYDHKHHQKKKVYYLKFPNLVLSLYAYMIFEGFQLRPYFVTEEEFDSKN